jgi:hypothetical protein
MAKGQSAEKAIKDIRRKTRRRFSADRESVLMFLIKWRSPLLGCQPTLFGLGCV